MAFWDGYWKSLKSLDVEEPIDVWLHRPLAYLLTRALLPTPFTPNQVTFGSMLFGAAGGVSLVRDYPWHMQVAGACLFASAIFDCADGQLARLRGTSSPFGRMLDGMADLIVTIAFVVGGTWHVWQKYEGAGAVRFLALATCLATAFTSSFHTASHDHYKNVFLKFTIPTFKDAEDWDQALDRFRKNARTDSLAAKITWPVYLFYVFSVISYVHSADPYAPTRMRFLPPYSDENARIYRDTCGGTMRAWRSVFGFGSLVFGVSVAAALDVMEWYCLLRVTLQNAVFYSWLRPWQKRASQRALSAMGIDPGVVAVGL